VARGRGRGGGGREKQEEEEEEEEEEERIYLGREKQEEEEEEEEEEEQDLQQTEYQSLLRGETNAPSRCRAYHIYIYLFCAGILHLFLDILYLGILYVYLSLLRRCRRDRRRRRLVMSIFDILTVICCCEGLFYTLSYIDFVVYEVVYDMYNVLYRQIGGALDHRSKMMDKSIVLVAYWTERNIVYVLFNFNRRHTHATLPEVKNKNSRLLLLLLSLFLLFSLLLFLLFPRRCCALSSPLSRD
jgi:hypothetical protein